MEGNASATMHGRTYKMADSMINALRTSMEPKPIAYWMHGGRQRMWGSAETSPEFIGDHYWSASCTYDATKSGGTSGYCQQVYAQPVLSGSSCSGGTHDNHKGIGVWNHGCGGGSAIYGSHLYGYASIANNGYDQSCGTDYSGIGCRVAVYLR